MLYFERETMEVNLQIITSFEMLKERIEDGIARRKSIIKHKYKMQLWEEQNGRCCFCDCITFPDSTHHNRNDIATIEHVKPKSLGGSNSIENYKISCFSCNSARGNVKYEEFGNLVLKHGRPTTWDHVMFKYIARRQTYSTKNLFKKFPKLKTLFKSKAFRAHIMKCGKTKKAQESNNAEALLLDCANGIELIAYVALIDALTEVEV